jgi:addiction module HigA family antidote
MKKLKSEPEELKVKPPHPGEHIREEILPTLGRMTITEVAERLGVSRVALSELINERRSVSLEMAQRLGKAFGGGARFWLALQMQRDAWDADHIKVTVKPIRGSPTAA